jgi:hypothetical protein
VEQDSLVSTAAPAADHARNRTCGFVVAWVFALLFYFREYAVRSSPSVMIPHYQISRTFHTTALGISSILVFYYCTMLAPGMLVSNPEQMPRVLHLAMQSAVGKGGVGVVVLPGDVAGMHMPSDDLPRSIFTARPAVRPCEQDLARLADALNGAGPSSSADSGAPKPTTRWSRSPTG